MPDALVRVALTGGIATGKSYIRQRLQQADLPTIDADGLAREALAPGTPGFRAAIARFGRDVLSDGGAIDRVKLASIVFADPTARIDLEAIVHPDVYRRIDSWFTTLARNGYRGAAVADVPLLFESGHADDFHVVVVAACDEATQIARLQARDGFGTEAARLRIAAQWPLAEKVRRADFVVRTDGSFEETDARVEEVVEKLRQVRGGRREDGGRR